MVKDKIELFIEERQDKIVKYIEKVLTQIKNTEVKKIFLGKTFPVNYYKTYN